MVAEHDVLLASWRIAIISLGAFVVGFSLFIGRAYHRGLLRSGIYRKGFHVFAIMVSYCLLAGALIAEMAHRAIDDDPITWRLPLATVAFGLGAYSLHSLTKVRAKQSRKDGGGAA